MLLFFRQCVAGVGVSVVPRPRDLESLSPTECCQYAARVAVLNEGRVFTTAQVESAWVAAVGAGASSTRTWCGLASLLQDGVVAGSTALHVDARQLPECSAEPSRDSLLQTTRRALVRRARVPGDGGGGEKGSLDLRARSFRSFSIESSDDGKNARASCTLVSAAFPETPESERLLWKHSSPLRDCSSFKNETVQISRY